MQNAHSNSSARRIRMLAPVVIVQISPLDSNAGEPELSMTRHRCWRSLSCECAAACLRRFDDFAPWGGSLLCGKLTLRRKLRKIDQVLQHVSAALGNWSRAPATHTNRLFHFGRAFCGGTLSFTG